MSSPPVTRVLPPPAILSNQKLADYYQTARMGKGTLVISHEALASICQELLYHRQVNGETMTALKVALGVGELVEVESPAPESPLFEPVL